MRKRSFALLGAGALIAGGVAFGTASPAFACYGGSGGYGQNCQGSGPTSISGAVIVPNSISYTTNVGAWTLNVTSPGVYTDVYSIYENSNDSQGVQMDLAGPPQGLFTNNSVTCANNQTLPGCTIQSTLVKAMVTGGGITGASSTPGVGACGSASVVNGNAGSETPVALQNAGSNFVIVDDQNPSTGQLQCAASGNQAGWDSFTMGGFAIVNPPGGLSAGEFDGALTMSQWGD